MTAPCASRGPRLEGPGSLGERVRAVHVSGSTAYREGYTPNARSPVLIVFGAALVLLGLGVTVSKLHEQRARIRRSPGDPSG